MLWPTSTTPLLDHSRKQKNPLTFWPASKVKIICHRMNERFCLQTKVEKVILFLCMFERKKNRDRGKKNNHVSWLQVKDKVWELAFPLLWVVEIELIHSCLHHELFYSLSHPTGLATPLAQLVRDNIEWWNPKKGKSQTWIIQVIVYYLYINWAYIFMLWSSCSSSLVSSLWRNSVDHHLKSFCHLNMSIFFLNNVWKKLCFFSPYSWSCCVWYAFWEAKAKFAEDRSPWRVQENMFLFPLSQKTDSLSLSYWSVQGPHFIFMKASLSNLISRPK